MGTIGEQFMSWLLSLKIGTAAGCIGGMVASAYFTGTAHAASKKDAPGLFAIASLFGGPFVGAAAGVSFYGVNKSIVHLKTAPRLTQLIVLSSIIAVKGAYILGKNSK